MPAATSHVGINATCSWLPAGGGSAIIIKNSDWNLDENPMVKTAHNTTDGILRATGLLDYTGSVKGHVDQSQPIEADVVGGSIGTLKLYRNGTKFFSLTAIITGLKITTGVESVEDWSFDFALQSGTITYPI